LIGDRHGPSDDSGFGIAIGDRRKRIVPSTLQLAPLFPFSSRDDELNIFEADLCIVFQPEDDFEEWTSRI